MSEPEEEKFYYWVTRGPFNCIGERKTLILATNRGTAKRAWRHIHGRHSGLVATKLSDAQRIAEAQGITNKVLRHAQVLLGEWDD